MKRPRLDDLTLEEKIGQLMMVDQSDLLKKYVGSDLVLRDDEEIDNFMKKYQYGGLWCYGYVKMDTVTLAEFIFGKKSTIEDNKKLVDKLNKYLKTPLIVAMDCEGGNRPDLRKRNNGSGRIFNWCCK